MFNEIKAKVDYTVWDDSCALYFRINAPYGKHYRLELNFVEYDPPAKREDFEIKPSGIVDTTQVLQAILDACWEYGMRPTGFKNSNDETAAIKYHLEDMRMLVFKNALK